MFGLTVQYHKYSWDSVGLSFIWLRPRVATLPLKNVGMVWRGGVHATFLVLKRTSLNLTGLLDILWNWKDDNFRIYFLWWCDFVDFDVLCHVRACIFLYMYFSYSCILDTLYSSISWIRHLGLDNYWIALCLWNFIRGEFDTVYSFNITGFDVTTPDKDL